MWLILIGPDKFFDRAVGTMGTGPMGTAFSSVPMVTISNSR